MYIVPRASLQNVNGVEYFLNFAFKKSSQHGEILCPCTDCHNRFHLKREEVYHHLICDGFKRGYMNWTNHEESHEVASSSMMETVEEGDNDHEMREILHDLFPMVSSEPEPLNRMDKAKITRKRANTDTRTEERARAGSQRKEVQEWQVKFSHLKGTNYAPPFKGGLVEEGKHKRKLGFALESHHNESTESFITDCHAGNPMSSLLIQG
ncbi:transposase-associated domain-containing protein [Tanacetum coccineum]